MKKNFIQWKIWPAIFWIYGFFAHIQNYFYSQKYIILIKTISLGIKSE